MHGTRRHLSYANIVATLALLFAMSGGALAATHYLVTSTRQISPKVLKKLRGETGPAGARGATGAAGSAGAEGKEGKEGKGGKEGKEGKEGKGGATGAPASEDVAEAWMQIEKLEQTALNTKPEEVLSTHSSGNGVDLKLRKGSVVHVDASVEITNGTASAGSADCKLGVYGTLEEDPSEARFFGEPMRIDIPANSTFMPVALTGSAQLSGGETYDLGVYCFEVSGASKMGVAGGGLNAFAIE